jgi:pimeloyl-ACP methyl ester carboxylesterase
MTAGFAIFICLIFLFIVVGIIVIGVAGWQYHKARPMFLFGARLDCSPSWQHQSFPPLTQVTRSFYRVLKGGWHQTSPSKGFPRTVRRDYSFRASRNGLARRKHTVNFTKQHVTLADGRRLAFAEYGDRHGEPVLEFHGIPGSRLEAWYYDDAGKKLGARIIGIDRPGFGFSSYKRGYRFLDWPSDVVEFANTLGLKRFGIAGISSGSPYALACARVIPERLKGCAVVSGISPLKVQGEDLNPWHHVLPAEILMAYMAHSVPLLAKIAFRYLLQQIRKDPARAMTLLMPGAPRSDLELLKDERAKWSFQQIVAESSRGGLQGPIESIGLEVKDWGFSLKDITMRISIWQGEVDNVVYPRAARYMSATLPNNVLHMVPDAGHLTVVARHAEAVLAELLVAK